MPRILSLDKMIQDLRGAMANENAQKGFMQGYQEGQARQQTQAAEHGRAAGRGASEASAMAGPGRAAPPAATPSNYDEMAQAYFQTLADMDKAPEGRPELAALDAAHGNPTIPGAAPALQGAPPPPGGYDAPAPGNSIGGLTPEQLAALDAAARNPNAAVPVGR